MKRALIGVRCSTDEQLDKYGPELQLQACLDAAAAQDFAVELEGLACSLATRRLEAPDGCDVVLDHQSVTKFSSSAEIDLDEPFYRALFGRLEEGGYAAYLTYDQTRLTRSGLLQQLLLEAEIKRHVDQIVYATFQVDDRTDEGRLIRQIMASVNEYRSRMDRLRLITGRVSKAAKGLWPGGKVLYGYQVGPDGRYAVYEPLALVVRQIFAWYTYDGADLKNPLRRGQGTDWIADRLNARGIPSPAGAPWHKVTVSRILRNEAYAGKSHYGRGDHRVELAMPPIVDRETFQRAQDRRAAARDFSRREVQTGRFLCHRRIRCGHCGSRVRVSYSHGLIHRARYSCEARWRRPGYPICPSGPQVLASRLDDQVRFHLQALANGRGLQYAFTGYLEVWQREWEEAERMLPQVEVAIADIEAEIERANVNFARGRWDDARTDAYVREARARARAQQDLAEQYRLSLARQAGFQELLRRAGIDDPADVLLLPLPPGALAPKGAVPNPFDTVQHGRHPAPASAELMAPTVSGAAAAAALADVLDDRPTLTLDAARNLLQEYDVSFKLFDDRVEMQGLIPLPTIQLPDEGNAMEQSWSITKQKSGAPSSRRSARTTLRRTAAPSS